MEAAAGALGEVLPVHQDDVEAAQRRVPGHPGARRATADHQDLGAERHHQIRLPPQGLGWEDAEGGPETALDAIARPTSPASVDPVERARDGLLPVLVVLVALVADPCWAPSACPRPSCRGPPAWLAQKPTAMPGRVGRRPARSSRRPRGGSPARPRMSAWNCMSRSLWTMPPSTLSDVQGRRPSRSSIASIDLAGLERRRLQRRAGDVARVDVAGQAGEHAAGVGLPVRREQARERRHDVQAAVVVDRLGQLLDLAAPP